MAYKILANAILVMHFLWIVFMLAGFVYTLLALFYDRLLDRWLLRTLHLFGIIYVGALAVLRQYCPLTLLENILRNKYTASTDYRGPFILRNLEKVVYPEIDPYIILIPTIFIAVFTLTVFILKPPAKIKDLVLNLRKSI